MDWNVWGRYFVELMLCLPAGLLCLAPVEGRLRRSMGSILLAVGVAITLFAALGALIILQTGWPENVLLIPGMLLFFELYRSLIRVDNMQAVFVFLTAAEVMGFCAVFTDVLLAGGEISNIEAAPSW